MTTRYEGAATWAEAQRQDDARHDRPAHRSHREQPDSESNTWAEAQRRDEETRQDGKR